MAKVLSFRFSSIPSSEYLGLISFRIYWFDLLAVQGTLQSFLQQRTSKASVLWHSPFFMLQLSYQYMTTGKIIAWVILWSFFFDCSEFNISEINIYLNWFPESTNLNSLSTALTILAHQWFRSQDLEEKKSYEGRWSWKTGCTLVYPQKLHSPCSRVSQRCLASCAT